MSATWMSKVGSPRQIAIGCLAVCAALFGCSTDRLSAPEEVSAIDGKALSSKAMNSLRAQERGCTFTLGDPTGGVRMLGLHGKRLPFALRPLTRGSGGAHGDGRSMRLQVTPADHRDTVTMSCWVPESMGIADLSDLALQVNWNRMFGRLLNARLVPVADIKRGLSREVEQFRYESLDPNPPRINPLRGPTAGPGGALRTTFGGCDYTVITGGTTPPSGPKANFTGGCRCDTKAMLDQEGNQMYDGGGNALIIATCYGGGTTYLPTLISTAPRPPDVDWSALLADLEGRYCGYTDCYIDNVTPDEMYSAVLNVSNAGGVIGDEQTFSVQPTSLYHVNVYGYTWSWHPVYPDNQTSASTNCQSYASQCSLPVYTDGYMTVAIQTASGDAYPFAHTFVNPDAATDAANFGCQDGAAELSTLDAGRPFNKVAFAKYLRDSATATKWGTGHCAEWVRRALCNSIGGNLACTESNHAKYWAPFLRAFGFDSVAFGTGLSTLGPPDYAATTGYPSLYQPAIGDIAVFTYGDYGHVCAWDGLNWISDFIQPDIQPSPTHPDRGYTVFRKQ